MSFDQCLLPDFLVIDTYHLDPTVENLVAGVDFTCNAIHHAIPGGELLEKGCTEGITRIYHELAAFIGQAFKGAADRWYCKPSITPHMEASDAPPGGTIFGGFCHSAGGQTAPGALLPQEAIIIRYHISFRHLGKIFMT